MRAVSTRVVSLLFGVAALVVACGTEDNSTFGNGTPDGANGSSGGFGGGGNGDGGTGQNGPCVGLACNQKGTCANGSITSLTGKVFDPSGTVPLYNAIVYVPNAPLEPFKAGVSCETCAAGVSGSPIATALTNAKGEFKLDNVPVGVDFPLVVQMGRWRRQIDVKAAQVQECQPAPVAEADTRLPRNPTEGDIPKIAIATGNADSLECFVRKLGVDANQFTNPADGGRINIYQGLRGGSDGSKIDNSTPSGQSLWDDIAELRKYDMVILSCEGNENAATKSDAAKNNIKQYLDEGGRVFASHYHYDFYRRTTNGLQNTADWGSGGNSTNLTVDTSFAKGQAFGEWLDAVGATTSPGSNQIPATELRSSIKSVPAPGQPATMSRRWLYATPTGSEVPKFYSFNTPLDKPADQQCGRGVYTDIHVSSGDKSGGTFPANCTTSGFTEQEKALLFLLFDLSSCVQDDSKPPIPPPPSVN